MGGVPGRFSNVRPSLRTLICRVLAGLPGREPGLSAEDRGRAASLYEAGLTLTHVAEQMAVGVDTVRAAVLAEGGQIRPRGRVPRHLRQQEVGS